MPNYLSRKDIASLVGKSVQYIGVNVKRGKLIEKNKRIDTDNPKNKAFLSQFIAREVWENQQIESSKNGVSEEDSELLETDSKKPTAGNIKYELDLAELRLKRARLQKERLDLDKKKGMLIEVKASVDVMQRAVVVLSSQYRQNSKNFLMELVAKYNIQDKDIAGIQKIFDNMINKAVAESKDLIRNECEIIASEYSETLNRGESKK